MAETESISSLWRVSQCQIYANKGLVLTNEFDTSTSIIGGDGGGGIARIRQSARADADTYYPLELGCVC